MALTLGDLCACTRVLHKKNVAYGGFMFDLSTITTDLVWLYNPFMRKVQGPHHRFVGHTPYKL